MRPAGRGPDDVRTARELVAATQWRRRVAAHPAADKAYRVVVGVVGVLVVAVGLVTVPLPGPGWLTVLAGLFVLASEFPSAEHLLAVTRRHVTRWTGWAAAQPPVVRLLIATAGAVFAYAALVVTLQVVGAPPWLPRWLPLAE